MTDKKKQADVLENTSQIIKDKKIYVLERHFTGKREITEAINTVILNSLKCERIPEKTA